MSIERVLSGNYRSYRKRDPRKSREACLRKYGLKLEDYDRMLQEQGGGCAICGKLYEDRPLAVDHNHETGVVRQLLCYRCNNVVGIFEKNESLLGKVVEYLSRHTKIGVN